MKFDEIKKLPEELQPLAMEIAAIHSIVERLEEKIISVMHNQIALNETIKHYEAAIETEIHSTPKPEEVKLQ